ncbi:glycolipid transfer protein [Nadsonia fulvescens var. elongata DSM 6958]|uniref:Glycolipid transfer protein n=1 Tax=Nadsonia fulvescens var. elongata DSM 6958 TaxID=857566 RepID=A0A1E3PFB2_9ASCO|nr:glycolipid transfer protein [Nadsonia fulvescens var. elongata DSM 6958]
MSSYFSSIKKDFKDVPVSASDEIDTAAFLDAAESLVTLFDLFGSSAFGVVQKDMTGNIKKIREVQLRNPVNGATLQQIVLSEKDNKTSQKPATQGLLWLSRGLEFTALAMRKNVADSSQELATSFTESYKATLSQHHSILIRPVFKLAMNACPYRKVFYEKLCGSQSLEIVQQQLEQWLSALEKIVKIIMDFFAAGKYGKGL